MRYLLHTVLLAPLSILTVSCADHDEARSERQYLAAKLFLRPLVGDKMKGHFFNSHVERKTLVVQTREMGSYRVSELEKCVFEISDEADPKRRLKADANRLDYVAPSVRQKLFTGEVFLKGDRQAVQLSEAGGWKPIAASGFFIDGHAISLNDDVVTLINRFSKHCPGLQ